ncbi:MAG: hypothetical protein JWO82_1504 [Akkermansiaceae bacterium]|nr:hypothetical protein [Akkermansiaceae bacterium]
MKRNLSIIIRRTRGYTLIEITMVLLVSLVIGSMLMTLANQQFTFLKIFQSQNFLTEEAPIINNQLARIIGQADRFRIHSSVADAVSGVNPRLTAGPVVLLYFRQPDGTMLKGIISFENRNGSKALYYYTVPATGVLSTPDWSITKRPTNVVFSIEQGILRTTLTGPSNEQIIYSGTMQQ